MKKTPRILRLCAWAAPMVLLAAGCAGGPGGGRESAPAFSAPAPASRGAGDLGEVERDLLGLRRGLSNQEERIEEVRKAVQNLVDGLERSNRNHDAALKKLAQQFDETRGRLESIENEVALLRQGRTGAPATPVLPEGAPAAPQAPAVPEGQAPAAGSPPQTATAPPAAQPPAGPPVPPAPKPPDPEEEFNQALKVIQGERSFPRGRALLSAFLAKHPTHELSDDAQYWIGQTYFEERNYERAILAFNKVQVDYANGDKASDALLQEAMSFLNLGDKASARELLMRLMQKYPNSEAAKTAEDRLKSIP